MAEKRQCEKAIFHGFGLYKQRCRNTGVLEHDGKWWCKTHYPPTVEAKRAARNAKWDAEQESRRAAWKSDDDAKAELERKAAAYDRLTAWLSALDNNGTSDETQFTWHCERIAEIRAVLEGRDA